MSVCSLSFLALCIAVVTVFHLAPGKLLRQLILAATSAAFLYTLVPNERSWIFFAVVLAGSYVALTLVRLLRKGAVVAALIALVLVVFLYVKRYEFFASFVPVPMDWNL